MSFLFPGQGSQFVGMGVNLRSGSSRARSLYSRASAVLGYDLAAVCEDGPSSELEQTWVCQPATLVHSIVSLQCGFPGDDPPPLPSVALGLSLGEYTALCAAGSLTFEDAIRLVDVRGRAMQAAADATPSGMLTLSGLGSSAEAEDLCASVEATTGGVLRPANYLYPGCVVVSGTESALSELERRLLSNDNGGVRSRGRLRVAGAFHTEVMRPAKGPLQEALRSVEILPPRVPIVSNVDGKAHRNPDDIARNLVNQLTQPVLWEQSLSVVLSQDFGVAYEIGPGRSLAGTLRRVSRRAPVVNIGAKD